MFNFGSILFWVYTKSYLPDNSFIMFIYGLLSGAGLLFIAERYLNEIDLNSKKE